MESEVNGAISLETDGQGITDLTFESIEASARTSLDGPIGEDPGPGPQGSDSRGFDLSVDATATLAATPTSANLLVSHPSQIEPVDINVGNTGAGESGLLTVTLDGVNSGDFVIVKDDCSTTTLAPGRYCTITLAYEGVARGTATLTVSDTGTGASTISVPLSGGPVG
jgi:hypothetical protein